MATQDFEGSITYPQYSDKGDIATSNPYTGTESLHYTVLGEGITANWHLAQPAVGSFSDVYLSYWLFLSSAARMSDELFVANLVKSLPDANYQQMLVDWTTNLAGNFNSTDFRAYIEPQFTEPGGVNVEIYSGINTPLPLGTWAQVETWYHPNSPGSSNGFLRMYLNGALLFSAENRNLNGTLDMSGLDIEASGVLHEEYLQESRSFVCSNHRVRL